MPDPSFRHLAAVAVDGPEVAVQASVKHKTAVGHQGASPVRIRIGNVPGGLAGQHIKLLEFCR
jgi:hypothetical protein